MVEPIVCETMINGFKFRTQDQTTDRKLMQNIKITPRPIKKEIEGRMFFGGADILIVVTQYSKPKLSMNSGFFFTLESWDEFSKTVRDFVEEATEGVKHL